ncbi:hypothetical protein BDL97_11G042300 [Sphagnum fallax]|nr:hypothetical protein BDL97_11G042300 [Sphagnum fallax]
MVKIKKTSDRTCSDSKKETCKELQTNELKKQQEQEEKEQKRNERESMEVEKDRKKKERDLKRQQDEADKEQRRKERELKRQQEEAEKEQKKKEKEAAERKKQLVIQKQATIMDKLFRRKEPETPAAQPQGADMSRQSLSPMEQSPESSTCSTGSIQMIIAHMDQELTAFQSRNAEELMRLHLATWQSLKKAKASEKLQRWGLRRKPKVTVYRELRLQGSATASCQKAADSGASSHGKSGVTLEMLPTSILKRSRDEDSEELKVEVDREDSDCIVVEDSEENPRKKRCNMRWKLLQFDKSYRPAYYGTFSRTSATIGPRHPLKKDLTLNYEVDSDEEWEEEDPGESLSDCEDKEDDVDKVDNEVDEDVADGFVVPDGYLSDSEGVHLDDAGTDGDRDTLATELSCASQEVSSSPTALEQEFQKHERLTKLLDNVTKQALIRNRPFIVSMLTPKSVEQHTQTELQCLQALKMQVVLPHLIIVPPNDVQAREESEMEIKTGKVKKTKESRKRRLNKPSSVMRTSSTTVAVIESSVSHLVRRTMSS